MSNALRGGEQTLKPLLERFPDLVNEVTTGGATPLHMCGMGRDNQKSTAYIIRYFLHFQMFKTNHEKLFFAIKSRISNFTTPVLENVLFNKIYLENKMSEILFLAVVATSRRLTRTDTGQSIEWPATI